MVIYRRNSQLYAEVGQVLQNKRTGLIGIYTGEVSTPTSGRWFTVKVGNRIVTAPQGDWEEYVAKTTEDVETFREANSKKPGGDSS